MNSNEISGRRKLDYSLWHRRDSIKNYIPHPSAEVIADCISTTDIDWCEYCKFCREPLALIETKEGHGNTSTQTDIITKLALCYGIPAFLVVYVLNNRSVSSVLSNGAPIFSRNISSFLVTRLDQDSVQQRMSPTEYARFLADLHMHCACDTASKLRQRYSTHDPPRLPAHRL